MYPQHHFIIGLPFSIILIPIIGFPYALLFLLASFLVDFDHYMAYYFKKKDFSVKRAYNYWKNRKGNDELMIFHTIEFYMLLLLLSLIHKLFLVILAAIVFHEIFDIIYMIKKRIYNARALSLVMWLKRRNFFIYR